MGSRSRLSRSGLLQSDTILVFSIYLCSICLLKYSSAASYSKLPFVQSDTILVFSIIISVFYISVY